MAIDKSGLPDRAANSLLHLLKNGSADAPDVMSSADEPAGLEEQPVASFDPVQVEEEKLLAIENEVCSQGDTVHYAEKPTIFEHCEGSYLYDGHETPYLDLQMWYSAVNLGYGNERVNNALKKQVDKLPQLACQYLHREKI